MSLLFYTDGSCLGNPGPGGYAAIQVVMGNKAGIIKSGHEVQTTNNRMEMMGVLAALEAANGKEVIIYTDSQYTLKGATEWLPGWKARNWVKADKKPVLNADLWKRIDALMGDHVTLVKVKGHSGNFWNDEVDALACKESQRAKKKLK